MSFWKNDPIVSQPKPVLSVPNARADAKEGREERSAEIDETKLDITLSGEDRAGRSEIANLRKEFTSQKEVQEYTTALQSLAAGLNTADNASGDIALIYAYAKIMDPGSVVRESEMSMASSADPKVQSFMARMGKEFGLDGGGNLSPQGREKMRREMINSAAQRAKSYNQKRAEFEDLASSYGFDSKQIVGRHAAQPYAEQFTEYDKRNKVGRFADDTPAGINMIGGVPEGSEIQWGGNTPGPEFDRAAWLQQSLGWTPTQEAIYIDLLNKNAGKTISGENLMKLAASYGVPLDKLTVEDFNRDAARLPNGGTWSPQKPQEQIEWERRVEELKRERDTLGGGVDAAVRGAADTASIGLADKGAALMDTVFDGGTYQDNLNEQYAVNAADEVVNPWARMGGQVAGGLAIPFGAGARTPGQLAKVGAAYGGGYEFNKSNEDFLDRIDNVAGGAAFGGAAGYGGGKLGNFIAGKFPARTGQPNTGGAEYYDAAIAEGIQPSALDVGGPTAKRIGQATAQSPYGSAPMIEASNKVVSGVDDRLTGLASETGTAARRESFGNALRDGGRSVIDKAKGSARSKYRAAERQVGSDGVASVKTTAVLDDQIAALEKTGLSSKVLGTMQALRGKLAEGAMDVDTLRRVRTRIRSELIDAGATPGEAKEFARNINNAITEDVADTLTATGKGEYANVYREADADWQAMSELRDTVFDPIIGKADAKGGPKSADAIVTSLMKDLESNGARAAKFLRALPEEAQQDTTASIIASLGRKGGENADESVFSLGGFLTQYRNMSESAKSAYFGKELRDSLNNLMKVAEGANLSGKYAGHSNTGAVNAVNFTNAGLSGAFVSLFTGNFAAAAALATPAATQRLTAAVMTSPRFVKWLAGSAKKPNPQAAKAHILRLDNLAKTEPTIGAEIIQIKDYLLKQLAETPQRAAAEDRQQSPQSSATTNTPQVGQ